MVYDGQIRHNNISFFLFFNYISLPLQKIPFNLTVCLQRRNVK